MLIKIKMWFSKKRGFEKNLHVQKQHSRVGTFPPLTNRGRGNAGGTPGGIKLLSWHLRFTSSLKIKNKSLAPPSTWKVQPACCARPKHVHPAELVQSHGQPGEVAHLVGGLWKSEGCGEVRMMISPSWHLSKMAHLARGLWKSWWITMNWTPCSILWCRWRGLRQLQGL